MEFFLLFLVNIALAVLGPSGKPLELLRRLQLERVKHSEYMLTVYVHSSEELAVASNLTLVVKHYYHLVFLSLMIVLHTEYSRVPLSHFL